MLTMATDERDDLDHGEAVDDGFGNEWVRCSRADCDLHVVRPGKVQCRGEHDEKGCPMNQREPLEGDELRVEFERRVSERLAEWQARYDRDGVATASPLMDQIMAEKQVRDEMEADGTLAKRGG